MITAVALLALQTLATGDSLLARGDTNAALRIYERLANDNWRNAEAQWRAGAIHMARHRPGSQNSAARRRAEERFRYATRGQPDSAKYWLDLAALFRGDSWLLTRLQVEGLLRDAIAAAERSGDSAWLAEAAYRSGRNQFEEWERFAHRRLQQIGHEGIDLEHFHTDWDYVTQVFNDYSTAIGDAGAEMANGAARALERATQVRPTHVDAAALLVVVLVETGRVPEALVAARKVARAAPDSARAWTILGLANARADRWRDAQEAFEQAFARMRPDEVAPYRDPSRLLREADRVRFAQAGAAERASMERTYWMLNQPLLLTDENEVRTEYYARIAYANIRWSDPTLGLRGEETDRGLIYVRYGPPDVAGMFPYRNTRSLVAWVYWPAELRFVFEQNSGFTNARLQERSEFAFNQHRRITPGRFDNVPAQRTLDTIGAQVVQFRGSGDTTDVTVFTWIPYARMVGEVELAATTFTSAAFVLSQTAGTRRLVREETVDPRSAAAGSHRTWRLPLTPETYLLRFEATAPTAGSGARHSEVVGVRALPPGEFAMSDILIARSVAERDSNPGRWTDFFIEPSAAHVRRDEPVAFLWEMYDLQPDDQGIVRWQVELAVRVAAIERREWNNVFFRVFGPLFGHLGDLTGASALGDEPVSLSWDQSRTANPNGVTVDWVSVNFGIAPPGTYEVTVIITDLATGREVFQRRTLTRSTFEPGQ